jgi:asparagine synthase (glutamine-hydrolysing)
MDSSAIVCMADQLSADSEIIAPVATVSFYDPTEPHWDDHLYFSVVETRRGAKGTHMSVSASRRTFEAPSALYPLPGADSGSIERELEFEKAVGPGRVRAIIAGHGGDELLGGRADPIPELADYVIKLHWRTFSRHAFAWAISLRKSFIGVARDSGRLIWDNYPSSKRKDFAVPPWIPHFPIRAEEIRQLRLWQSPNFGYLPSALDRQDTWENLTDTLPHIFHAASVRYEYRYPFLDKDLVEFLVEVPPSQLRRPNRRRYMMRKALQGIVPPEILERRRKAYISRGPLIALQSNKARIASLMSNGELARRGLIDSESFLQMLSAIADSGVSLQWLPAMGRAIELELWVSQAAQAPITPICMSYGRSVHAEIRNEVLYEIHRSNNHTSAHRFERHFGHERHSTRTGWGRLAQYPRDLSRV